MMQDDTLVKIKDFWWTFILPSICLFGFCTNLINIFVFVQLKSKNPIYKLMLANSVTNFMYSFICFFVFVMRCGEYCELENTYLAKVYEKYLFYYFTSVLGLFNILIEVAVAAQRYFIVVNKPILNKKNIVRILIVCLFILALVVYLPQLSYRRITSKVIDLRNEIKSIANATNVVEQRVYFVESVNSNRTMKIFLLIVSSFRGLLILLLLLVINLLLLHRFKSQVDKKQTIKGTFGKSHLHCNESQPALNKDESEKRDENFKFSNNQSLKSMNGQENDARAKKNMTRMIIWMSIFFFIGNLLNSLSFYVLEVMQFSITMRTFFILISNSLLFTSHGINIFFYYFFNKIYRSIFKVWRRGGNQRHLVQEHHQHRYHTDSKINPNENH